MNALARRCCAVLAVVLWIASAALLYLSIADKKMLTASDFGRVMFMSSAIAGTVTVGAWLERFIVPPREAYRLGVEAGKRMSRKPSCNCQPDHEAPAFGRLIQIRRDG